MANWMIALLVALTYREALAYLLANDIPNPSIRLAVAFISLFAATLLVGALVNHIIGILIRLTGLTSTDRTLGLLFGLVRGGIVVIVILLSVAKVTPVERDEWWAESTFIPNLMGFEGWATTASKDTVAWLVQFLSVS